MKLKDAYSSKESYDQPRQHIKKQRHYLADKGPSSQSYGFSNSHVWMWELDHKESWTPKNWYFRTVVLEKTWETLGQHRDQTSQSYRKSVLIIHWNNWCWSSNTLATWCKEPTHWKRPWCWERLKAGGEGDNKEWDWLHGITNSMDMSLSKLQEMVKIREPGVLQFMGLQRVIYDWVYTHTPSIRSIC